MSRPTATVMPRLGDDASLRYANVAQIPLTCRCDAVKADGWNRSLLASQLVLAQGGPGIVWPMGLSDGPRWGR